jgi:hypothetical protein
MAQPCLMFLFACGIGILIVNCGGQSDRALGGNGAVGEQSSTNNSANGGDTADSGARSPKVGDPVWFDSSVSLRVESYSFSSWPPPKLSSYSSCTDYTRNDLTNAQLAALSALRLEVSKNILTADECRTITLTITDIDGSVLQYSRSSCTSGPITSVMLPSNVDSIIFGPGGQPCDKMPSDAGAGANDAGQ